jgi:ATP-dependent RNA helicase RhlE
VKLFADPQMSRALVFTRTKRGADKVAHHLEMAGISVATIHGNKSQSQRERALGAFRAAKIRVLVATDIAARGIDIDQVTHVVNFELPDVPESYVHRIGRTARAGAAGIAISLCDVEERELLHDIERLTRKPIPAEDHRLDTTRGFDVPVQRQPHGGNGRGPGNRAADDRRAAHRKHQQQAPRGREQQGEKNRGFKSAGAARYRGAPKQSAGRMGSY